MPVHDWTRVEAGIFHDFHNAWLAAIRNVLNTGTLPQGYYALTEQHAGRSIPDVLTLHAPPPAEGAAVPPARGGLALADAPPRVRRKLTMKSALRMRRRSLAIRHVSGHRLVALIEVVSASNKDRPDHVEEFAAKVAAALELGIHVLVIDLFPPGPHDPRGMDGAVRTLLGDDDDSDLGTWADDERLALVSYVAGLQVEAYIEPLAVGRPLPEMPLFLQADRYINVPLEPTYGAAFGGEPLFWREVLERS
jgi:hypothetical protein